MKSLTVFKHNRCAAGVSAVMAACLTISGCSSITSGQTSADSATSESQLVSSGVDLSDGQSVQQLIASGNEALRAGDTEKALFEYLRALELDDKNKDIYFSIGLVHEYQGNWALAQAAYAKCVQLDASYIGALERMGTMQLRQRQYTRAEQSFDLAVELDQQRLAAIGTGQAGNNGETPYSGTQDISQLSNNVPTSVFDAQSPYYAYSGLGVIYDLEGYHHKAIVAFQTARSIRPDSVYVINNIGYSSYMASDLEVAEIMFKKAVTLNPEYKVAWRNLALVHVRRGEYEEAINILTSRVESESAAYNTVGYLCMLDGKYEVAETYFDMAIEASPTYFEAANENLKHIRQLYASNPL